MTCDYTLQHKIVVVDDELIWRKKCNRFFNDKKKIPARFALVSDANEIFQKKSLKPTKHLKYARGKTVDHNDYELLSIFSTNEFCCVRHLPQNLTHDCTLRVIHVARILAKGVTQSQSIHLNFFLYYVFVNRDFKNDPYDQKKKKKLNLFPH